MIGAPGTRRDVGLIGASVPRVEDARFLAGHGRYLADLAFPGVLHVAFLRSPHAHARIGRVDLASARAMPGVVTCVTAADLRDTVRPLRAASRMTGYHATDLLPLAADKVRYQGEPVVAVVAESRYVAEDAVDAIAVEWSPLPPVPDARAAMAAESPLVHEEFGTNVILTRAFRHGDVDPALAGAALVVRERFRFRRHAALPIENRAALAAWNADGLTLWSSTQVPGMVRDALAESLAVPGHRIRVVAPDVGGGFGLKSSVYAEEIAVAALARRVGRPVKWIGDRREDLLASTQAWDEEIDATLALDGHGTIRGLRASVLADVGAYSIVPWTASIEVIQVISFLPGPYRVPAYLGEGAGVATNKAPMGPYRGVGRPVATFVMESLLDRAARRLGLDPREIRRRNFITEFPWRSPSGIVWDSGSFAETLDEAARLADWDGVRAAQSLRGDATRRLGVGVASYVELTGIGSAIPASPGADIATGTEGATVRVDPTGTVTASFGLACHGQGHETTLAQVVADTLGARLDDVRVVHGDTSAGPIGTGTYASRSAVLGGGAAILASRSVREKALAIAAHQLEADARDIELQESAAWVRGAPDRRVSLREIARSAYLGARRLPKGLEPGLEATRYYDPFFGTASSATHIAVVEVDLALGAVTVLRHVVVEDCGRVINPRIVEGQTIGGVAQGIGGALLEELVYDDQAQLATGSLMDYLPPTAWEIPPIVVRHLDRPSPSTIGGFKGVGEGGTIGAPAAIANAVSDALGSLGVEIAELPVTPDRIFRLLASRAPRTG
ncbi:MAG: dehydrogenase [Candidatus Rokuibacteriota bacterium]|nr:MAG: dehydrogenase [Candidatus Rokubacteria bacterium]